MESNRSVGLFRIFNGYVGMGTSAVMAFNMLQDLYQGGGVASAIYPLVVVPLIYSYGHAEKVFGTDLLHRRDNDFSPPDPFIKETPVFGELFYRRAVRELKKWEQASLSEQKQHESNHPRPSL